MYLIGKAIELGNACCLIPLYVFAYEEIHVYLKQNKKQKNQKKKQNKKNHASCGLNGNETPNFTSYHMYFNWTTPSKYPRCEANQKKKEKKKRNEANTYTAAASI